MKIYEIYDKYKIMPQLREHMFRVAGVAELICDNFDEPLAKENIIGACLLHDLGNIVKFQLGYFEKLSAEDLEYWEKVKKEFIQIYGENDHNATLEILKEIEIKKEILELAESGIQLIGENEEKLSFAEKICKYADLRTSPTGILSLRDRLDEWKERNNHKENIVQRAENLFRIYSPIEKQIFSKCQIKPEDITDEAIKPLISKYSDLVLE